MNSISIIDIETSPHRSIIEETRIYMGQEKFLVNCEKTLLTAKNVKNSFQEEVSK